MAYALADTGKRILILERGDFLPREDKNWDPDFIFTQRGYQIEEEWLDPNDEPYLPMAFYRVGGNTKVYGAVLQRNRPEDFGALRHDGGVSPAWPVDFTEMEPYYLMAEQLLHIHGEAGEDPTEGPRSAPYPFAPMPHEPRIQTIADQLAERGFTPFHNTLALNRDTRVPQRRPCIRCPTCDPYPCMLDAKRDAEVAFVRPALRHDNVSLWIGAYVRELQSRGRTVTRVVVEREGKTEELTADTVIVSGGAVNSAALLLRSAPGGLANSSGLVGRNLIKHNQTGIVAVAPEPNPTIFQKTLGVHDYYFGSPEHDYPLGAIQLTGKAPWQRLRQMADGDLPEAALRYMAAHSVDWWFTSEDLPDRDNRVEWKNGKIKFNYRPNNRRAHFQLQEIFTRTLRELGFYLFMKKTMELETVWHQGGTCVFGEDPVTSVLDRYCKAHDLDNLYVVDASFQPSMGAVNPTLTIVANALRVAEYLKGER